MGLKAQADIITAVIIILLAAALTSSAYLWGLPLVQKRQEVGMVTKVASYFDRENSNSLVKKIEYIAKNGGEETFTSEVSGIWELYPYDSSDTKRNSITFTFVSKSTNIAPNMGEIPFETSSISSTGYAGLDDASVVFSSSESSDHDYLIKYRLWFRRLESPDGKTYEIRLYPKTPGNLVSTGKTIRISRDGIPSPDPTNNNLIITKIQIFFG